MIQPPHTKSFQNPQFSPLNCLLLLDDLNPLIISMVTHIYSVLVQYYFVFSVYFVLFQKFIPFLLYAELVTLYLKIFRENKMAV